MPISAEGRRAGRRQRLLFVSAFHQRNYRSLSSRSISCFRWFESLLCACGLWPLWSTVFGRFCSEGDVGPAALTRFVYRVGGCDDLGGVDAAALL